MAVEVGIDFEGVLGILSVEISGQRPWWNNPAIK